MILWVFFILFSFSFAIVNGENWLVAVGVGDKQVFVPDSFDANVGDTVTFQFVAGTHSVMMSDTFGSCIKSSRTGSNTDIINGNPKNPKMIDGSLSTVGPIYYFCGVADHCSVGKMYATINVLEAGQPLKQPGILLQKSSPAKNDTLLIVVSALAGIFGGITLIIGSLYIFKKYKKPSKNVSEGTNDHALSSPDNSHYSYYSNSDHNNYNSSYNYNNNFEYGNNIMSIPDQRELSQRGSTINRVSNPGQEDNNPTGNLIYHYPGQQGIPSNYPTSYRNPGQEITQQQQNNLY